MVFLSQVLSWDVTSFVYVTLMEQVVVTSAVFLLDCDKRRFCILEKKMQHILFFSPPSSFVVGLMGVMIVLCKRLNAAGKFISKSERTLLVMFKGNLVPHG